MDRDQGVDVTHGLGHMTPKIFGICLNICSKLLELDFKFSTQLPLGKAE